MNYVRCLLANILFVHIVGILLATKGLWILNI